MNTTMIIISAAVVACVGIVVGLGLGIFGEKFKVDVDEREATIRQELPGNNCGGCGYPGCDALAKAINEGRAPANQCPVGGAAVGKRIATILGTESPESERKVAFVKCSGSCDKRKLKSEYFGIKDCSMVLSVPGGSNKTCDFGCSGFGNCVKACDFDAIHIIDEVAVVDKEKCMACGKCINACPKKIIEFIPYSAEHMVRCSSLDKGKLVRDACQAGCIGCALCVKNCPNEAIVVENNLARIEYSKCTGCGICAEKCPVKVIM